VKIALYIILILSLPVILLVALAIGLTGVGRVPYE
jgi:type III secretory pathway component EscS